MTTTTPRQQEGTNAHATGATALERPIVAIDGGIFMLLIEEGKGGTRQAGRRHPSHLIANTSWQIHGREGAGVSSLILMEIVLQTISTKRRLGVICNLQSLRASGRDEIPRDGRWMT